MDIKFGDEIEPVESYVDDKKRRFIFMSWMGGTLVGYARVATFLCEGEGFDEQGTWVKDFGLVLQGDGFVHKSRIKLIGDTNVCDPEGAVYAYMCATDWKYEVPFNLMGNQIFYSLESLKAIFPCVEECGIVKVKVSFVEVVQER